MPIEMKCSSCNRALRIPDNLQGKQFKCPHCKAVLTAGGAPQRWSIKAADGQIFGPVDKQELDDWVDEGRVTAESQFLREGSGQWQLAADIYPALATAAPPEVPAFKTEPAVPNFSEATPQASPSVVGVDTGSSSSYQATFRPRRYPPMKFVTYFFYGLAGLGAISLIVSIIVVFIFAGLASNAMKGADNIAGIITPLLVVITVDLVLFHGLWIAMSLFIAELGKIITDIQANTQETAFHTKAKNS